MTAFLIIFLINALPALSQGLLDPNTIVKWVDTLPIPAVMPSIGVTPGPGGLDTVEYHIGMYPIAQYYSNQFPVKTIMWGYGADSASASSPGNTIVTLRHHPMRIHWTNNLIDPYGNPLKPMFPVDRTIPWDDPYNEGPVFTPYTGPVPTVVHMHGAEVEATGDGHYSAWFTPDSANVPQIHGPTYNCNPHGQYYIYNNEQPSALIWYHDHSFGMDRLNVMAGLFGGVVIIDPANNPFETQIPVGDAYDIPLIVQDRMLDTNYQIAYSGTPTNPGVHPIWFPEFFGNINVVNGKIWPTLYVEQRHYRFRFLNGSNARFYHVYVGDSAGNQLPGAVLTQIGTDGGFLPNAVDVSNFLMGPAERLDFLVDFTASPVGSVRYLCNDAPGPYPTGTPVDSNTMMILKIVVVGPATVPDPVPLGFGNGSFIKTPPTQPAPTVTRNIVLYEAEGPGGPLAMYLDGIDMSDPRSIYKPTVNTVEKWNIINTTMDAHPMHIHLVQFQLLQRQTFNNDPVTGYIAAYNAANPIIPIPYDSSLHTVDVTPYLDPLGITPPNPNEDHAMKDTYVCPPAAVTTFLIKWMQEDNTPFGFDATTPPGYVWHCHILEHEENAMMREIHPIKPLSPMNTGAMVLHLDPMQQQAYGPVHYTNMMPMLNHWTDQSIYGNDAVQMNMLQQPMHDRYGLSCAEGVMFAKHPLYGTSSALSIPYSSYITTSNTDQMLPLAETKNLFVVFTPHSLMSRALLFEAGKTTSGFNIYLAGDRLLFGMWNRLERSFVQYNSPITIGHDVVYLAHLQYNSITKRFQAFVNGSAATSQPVSFQGLSADTNSTGIGCSSGGTRFHDFAQGYTNAIEEFSGELGDVMLFNTQITNADIDSIYHYLSLKYRQNWVYPAAQAPRGSWIVYEDKDDTPAMTGNNQHLMPAYPNPFSDESEFSVNLADKQRVNIELYNNYGVKVSTIFDGTLPKGNTMFNIQGSDLAPGMYVVRAVGDGFAESGKVMLVR